MCLIALAHLASSTFPLVIAANRDEDHERPTRDAHVWAEQPEVVGGTDALFGGSWLAVRRGGRFAAVTNLRGAVRRSRSRGALVRDFVTGEQSPEAYGEQIASVAEEYAGFHLLAGVAGTTVQYIAPELQAPLAAGVHAFSNAPRGETWPKVPAAIEGLRNVLSLSEPEVLIEELMRFLSTPRGTDSPLSEVFIRGNRYGTRSSTVVVATGTGILFAEQSFSPGGAPHGDRRTFRLA